MVIINPIKKETDKSSLRFFLEVRAAPLRSPIGIIPMSMPIKKSVRPAITIRPPVKNLAIRPGVKGTAVNLIADGADEATAVDTLSELIASDFTE